MKNIVALDVETTGLNPQNDFIIQLAMIKFDPTTYETIDNRMWYIEPLHAYEMSPQAQEKHGITKEFLKENGVMLKDICPEIIEFLKDCDILTYNGNHFDISFLYQNMLQVGFELDITNRVFYDAFSMYKKMYPSTLEAVYRHYTGNVLDGAHDAFNDVKATIEVFKHELKDLAGFEELGDPADMEENKISSPENSIRIINEEIVFAVGKYKDEEFMTVVNKDYSYVKWFLSNVASTYTRKLLKDYYNRKK